MEEDLGEVLIGLSVQLLSVMLAFPPNVEIYYEHSHVQAQLEVLFGVNRLSRFYIDTVNAFQK
jgi:hypothetical protein